MGDANEYDGAKIPQVDDEPMPDAPRHQAPEHPAYVRQRPAHRSVGTVSDFDDSGKEAPASIAHDLEVLTVVEVAAELLGVGARPAV